MFAKGKIIIFMDWESKTFWGTITYICPLCVQEASYWIVENVGYFIIILITI